MLEISHWMMLSSGRPDDVDGDKIKSLRTSHGRWLTYSKHPNQVTGENEKCFYLTETRWTFWPTKESSNHDKECSRL